MAWRMLAPIDLAGWEGETRCGFYKSDQPVEKIVGTATGCSQCQVGLQRRPRTAAAIFPNYPGENVGQTTCVLQRGWDDVFAKVVQTYCLARRSGSGRL